MSSLGSPVSSGVTSGASSSSTSNSATPKTSTSSPPPLSTAASSPATAVASISNDSVSTADSAVSSTGSSFKSMNIRAEASSGSCTSATTAVDARPVNSSYNFARPAFSGSSLIALSSCSVSMLRTSGLAREASANFLSALNASTTLPDFDIRWAYSTKCCLASAPNPRSNMSSPNMRYVGVRPGAFRRILLQRAMALLGSPESTYLCAARSYISTAELT